MGLVSLLKGVSPFSEDHAGPLFPKAPGRVVDVEGFEAIRAQSHDARRVS